MTTSLSLVKPIASLTLLGALLWSASAGALPPRSKLLSRTSAVRLDQKSPWVSGWSLEGEAVGLSDLLKRKREGYVVALSSTSCARCEDGLRLLFSAQDTLAQAGIQLVFVFSGDQPPQALNAWLSSRGLEQTKGGDPRWEARKPIILIDRYFSLAERLGGRERLPLSFVLGREGHVLRIIGQEGYDLVELIMSAVTGQVSKR